MNNNKYKLTYFKNIKGIVEPIRFLFTYLQIPYEYVEVDFSEWEGLKKDFKWGKLPILEYNGKMLTQSVAILNFLAEKHNMSPEFAWERAKSDEIMGAVNDLRLELIPIIRAKFSGDDDKVKELREQHMSGNVPLYLKNLNEMIKEFHMGGKAKSDFVFGGELPLAIDFYLAHFLDQWSAVLGEPNLLEKYDALNRQQSAVYSIASLAEYIKNRPDSII